MRVEHRRCERARHHPQRRIEQRPRAGPRCPVGVAIDEQERRVDDGGQQADTGAQDRRRAVGVVASKPRRQHHPAEHDPDRRDPRDRRPLVVEHPCGSRDEHHLRVGNHRPEAGTNERDRLVPEIQIEREQQAADDRKPALAPAAAILRFLRQPDDQQHGRGVGAAIERRGHRRHAGEPDEHRRKRDAQNAEQREQVNHETTILL